jgi:hypothetical protein
VIWALDYENQVVVEENFRWFFWCVPMLVMQSRLYQSVIVGDRQLVLLSHFIQLIHICWLSLYPALVVSTLARI